MQEVISALSNLGYQTGPAFPVGRPDRWTISLVSKTGVPLVAKYFPSGDGSRAFENMSKVWQSSFGERRNPPGLPKPVDYLQDLKILIMEKVEGQPLIELDEIQPAHVDEAIWLLFALHECEARPVKERYPSKLARSILRKAQDVYASSPASAEGFFKVAEALSKMHLTKRKLVPSHGDFSPRNTFLTRKRLVFIDWDRFQWADPLRDVAYFGLWCWSWALRKGQNPNWSVLNQAVKTYSALRPGIYREEYLRFHVAAGLARVAHGLITLWREDAPLAPLLLAEAMRWVDPK